MYSEDGQFHSRRLSIRNSDIKKQDCFDADPQIIDLLASIGTLMGVLPWPKKNLGLHDLKNFGVVFEYGRYIFTAFEEVNGTIEERSEYLSIHKVAEIGVGRDVCRSQDYHIAKLPRKMCQYVGMLSTYQKD